MYKIQGTGLTFEITADGAIDQIDDSLRIPNTKEESDDTVAEAESLNEEWV